MNECPCIDCLIFPLCKARVLEYMKNCARPYLHPYTLDREIGLIMYINVLKPKCSLIINWINKNNKYITPERYTVIYNIYK